MCEEMEGLGVNGDDLFYDWFGDFVFIEYVFKELMWMMVLVLLILCCVVKDFEFCGYKFLVGIFVGINIYFVYYMFEYWFEFEWFDLMCFVFDELCGWYKYVWSLFGGGVYMCLGLYFVYM